MLKLGFYGSVFALLLGQLALIGTLGETKIYLFDLVMAALAILGTLQLLLKSGQLKISLFLAPFYIFCLLAGVSLVFNAASLDGRDMLEAVSYLARFIIYVSAANVVYNMLCLGIIDISRIGKTYVLSALALSVAGFIQLKVLPDFSVLDQALGWDPHKFRLASTFFDPNYVGGFLVLTLTFLLFKDDLFTGKNALKKKQFFVLISITLLAVFLTYSRSAWGMLGVMLFIYGLARSPKIIFLSLILAFFTYFAVPRIQTRLAGITDPADSAQFRLISWKNTLNIAKDNLFLGVGFNNFKNSQVAYGYLTPDTIKDHSAAGSDSSLLLVLATTGIMGFLVFTAGMLMPIVKTKSLYSLVTIVPLLLESNFVNSLFYPQIMFLWLVMFALMEYGKKALS